jgi:hypothetical protein
MSEVKTTNIDESETLVMENRAYRSEEKKLVPEYLFCPLEG